MDNEQIVERIHALEVTQSAQAATQAGLGAALPAGIGGMATLVAAGGANLVIGIFLGLAIARAARTP